MSPDLRRRLRSAPLTALVRALSWGLGHLSWRATQRFGRWLGGVLWRLSRRDRRRTLAHLEIAFPDLDLAARQDLGLDSFRHHATSLAECLHLLRRDSRYALDHLRVEGWQNLQAARDRGRPIIILTGHCGNWELLGPAINSRGIGMAAVVRGLRDPGLEQLLLELRHHYGTETIERGTPGAARKLLKTLRGGGALLMLIDQDIEADGVWVPFFGRPAYTPLGAAQMALGRDALVLPVFVEREADGDHLVRILPPLDLPEDDPEAATARMTEAIEDQIRRRPAQWVWMHRRWRRQPPAAPASV